MQLYKEALKAQDSLLELMQYTHGDEDAERVRDHRPLSTCLLQ